MKKITAFLLAIVLSFSVVGCARKIKPSIDIKQESVTSIDFKRTEFSTQTPDGRDYYVKSVTDTKDVEALIKWIESLELEKHEAIEVPSERVEYVVILNGTKDHTVVFFDEYVIYDKNAFTYKNKDQSNDAAEHYNMLNYEESTTTLDLIV